MFTLITFSLLAITVVATLAAAPIVYLYKGAISGPTLHVMIIFAYFCIPQIFFYGVSSLIGAILELARQLRRADVDADSQQRRRDRGARPVHVAMDGLRRTPSTITATGVAVLGIGTTLGIIVQTAALVPALRRVGFRWHPRLDFRRAEVAEIGRMGGWMFGYVAATQVAFLVTTRVAGDTTTGISDYNYALAAIPAAVRSRRHLRHHCAAAANERARV